MSDPSEKTTKRSTPQGGSSITKRACLYDRKKSNNTNPSIFDHLLLGAHMQSSAMGVWNPIGERLTANDVSEPSVEWPLCLQKESSFERMRTYLPSSRAACSISSSVLAAASGVTVSASYRAVPPRSAPNARCNYQHVQLVQHLSRSLTMNTSPTRSSSNRSCASADIQAVTTKPQTYSSLIMNQTVQSNQWCV